jgi:putative transposase
MARRCFGSLKVERLHGQRFETRRQAKDEVLAWLLWYNSDRLHSTLAYVSPMQFEQNWFAAQPKQASARSQLWDTEFRGKVRWLKSP